MRKFIKIEITNDENQKMDFTSEGLTNIEVIGALRYFEKEMFVRMCQANEPNPKKDENATT